MTESDAVRALVEAINKVQVLSGRLASQLTADSHPIGSIDGFDSLNGIEVGGELVGVLGDCVPENPLLDDHGRSLTIRDAAKRILAAFESTKGASNGRRNGTSKR